MFITNLSAALYIYIKKRIKKEPKYLVEYPKEGYVLIAQGESLLNASLAAGIPLFHVCGGNALCSTCRVVVAEGAGWLTPPNEKEQALKKLTHLPPDVRLACQTYVTGGPVKLHRIIKSNDDIPLYTNGEAGAEEMGRQQELVLFFADIRNFTPIIEMHLAFDVIHIIRKVFAVFQTFIKKHRGRIIETSGDGLYAAFGFEGSNAEACRAAVGASNAILEEMEGLNETYFKPFFETQIELGIGLHSGSVVSGSITVEGQSHSVIMGYPVNIASRLQTATKELNNNFLVSDEVFQHLPHLSGVPSATVSLKGVSGFCKVYLLGRAYH